MTNANPGGSKDKKINRVAPRAKVVPGWGGPTGRLRRVLDRLELSNAEVSRRTGYSASAVGEWETNNNQPSAKTLKLILVSEGVWDLDRALSWWADGEGDEPRWLSDLTLDPTKEPVNGNPPRPGSPSGIAMPHAILEHARKALEATRVARAALANVADPGPSAWAKAALNDTAEAATKALDALSSLPSSSAPNKNISVVPMLLVA